MNVGSRSQTNMQPSINSATERTAQWGFAIALITLGVIGVVSYRSIASLRADISWVRHTYQVINRMEAVADQITQVQSAYRGFALTADDKYLLPLERSVRTLPDDLRRLQALTADNLIQQARLQSLKELVDELLAFGNQVIEQRRVQGTVAARELIQSNRGLDLYTRIQALLSAFKNDEERLLAERELQTTRGTDLTQSVIVLGGLLACGIVALALFKLRRDFAARAQAEIELERIYSLAQDLLCVSSVDGYFKRVNPAVQVILGWTPEEFLARPFLDMVHPDDHAATIAEVEKQVIEGRSVFWFENRYRHKDGSWRVLSWTSVPQPGGLMYATARDMTEFKQAAEELAQLYAESKAYAQRLEAANQELESFSYSVSHDLRAPLRHVNGYAEMLAREADEQLSDKARRYLKTIADASREMSVLIDELLAFSRMGRCEMRTSVVDSNQLISEVRRGLEFAIRERRIDWHIANLPVVRADAAMLKQVWLNLLDNAVKYTRGRELARIEVGMDGERDGRYVFYVRDNGAGFDMKYSDKLFGVFQRLHRSEEFEGTGIGLANVRRIISRHNGLTWADAQLNVGAIIYFTLQPA